MSRIMSIRLRPNAPRGCGSSERALNSIVSLLRPSGILGCRRRGTGEPSEEGAEEGVPGGRLDEGGCREQGREARLAAGWMQTIDQIAKRKQRRVLGERQLHGRQPAAAST